MGEVWMAIYSTRVITHLTKAGLVQNVFGWESHTMENTDTRWRGKTYDEIKLPRLRWAANIACMLEGENT